MGEARRQADDIAVAVELRTVNNRYFKFSLRPSEGYSSLEPQIETLVREQVKRGTVNVSLKVDRRVSPEQSALNLDVLDGYRKQVEGYQTEHQLPSGVAVEHLLNLPGVVRDTELTNDYSESAWPAIQATMREALARLASFAPTRGGRWPRIWPQTAS